jgi:glycosyltransferase involved in cell wall biosynthesis
VDGSTRAALSHLIERRMYPIFFNGKFYGASLNGVHRVADRLIREVDALLVAMPADERPVAKLFVPTGSNWLPELEVIAVDERPGASSQRWEQIVLPRLAAGGVLINLCNLAPIIHPRKILLLHDAQFLFSDSSYPWRQRIGYRLLVPLMAKYGARVLTVSEFSKQILDLMRVARKEDISVLYNGADHMTEADPDPEVIQTGFLPKRYVVIFGSSKVYKNVQVVFDAFKDPRLSDLQLVVIGEDRDRLVLNGLSVPDNAVFLGRISDSRLRALYSEALCLAFPSKTEGFGLPPVEAAFCGCPAVVSPGGAIPEICRDGVIYAGVDNSEDWISGIRTYADDDARRNEKLRIIAERARHFRWEAAGRKLLDHILEAAAEPKRRNLA